MRGLRVHLTGSAAKTCDGALLRTAHTFVQAFVKDIVGKGGGLVLGAGSEPLGDFGEPCIFDWTALQVIAEARDPASEWPAWRPGRFVAVACLAGFEGNPGALWCEACVRLHLAPAA